MLTIVLNNRQSHQIIFFMRKVQSASFIFLLLLTMSSCSVFKMSDRFTKKKLDRAGLAHHILEVENYTFSYWDSGESNKPVYVLLHGFGSSTHLQFFRQAKMLSKTHRVILPNLLYFGSNPKGEKDYKIKYQVEAMSVLLEELGINSMTLGGYSFGGIVATELALLKKADVEKLTIFASPVKFFNEDDLRELGARHNIKVVAELMVPADVTKMQRTYNLLQHKDKKMPKFILKDSYENLFQDQEKQYNYKKLLEELQNDMSYYANREYQFDFPVLLVWGDNDRLVPNRIGTELNEYFESSELHIIPKSGHGMVAQKKKKVNRILKDFLNR